MDAIITNGGNSIAIYFGDWAVFKIGDAFR